MQNVLMETPGSVNEIIVTYVLSGGANLLNCNSSRFYNSGKHAIKCSVVQMNDEHTDPSDARVIICENH